MKKIIGFMLSIVMMFGAVVPAFATGNVGANASDYSPEATLEDTVKGDETVENIVFNPYTSDIEDFVIYYPPVFKDVYINYWAFRAITVMAAEGIVNGVGNHMFAPNNVISVAEFCQILAGVAGYERGSENGYWAYKAIKSCIDAGVIESRGEITPENYSAKMIRQETVSSMVRLMKNMGKATVVNDIKAEDIPDFSKIDAKYQQEVLESYQYGISRGVDFNNTFAPKSASTRAQICLLLFMSNMVTIHPVEVNEGGYEAQMES